MDLAAQDAGAGNVRELRERKELQLAGCVMVCFGMVSIVTSDM